MIISSRNNSYRSPRDARQDVIRGKRSNYMFNTIIPQLNTNDVTFMPESDNIYPFTPSSNKFNLNRTQLKTNNLESMNDIHHYTNDDELYDTEPNYADAYYNADNDNIYRDADDDKYYDTDPDYNITQEWLLFQRQGDQYNNLSEWDETPDASYKESFNEDGVSLVNDGLVWGPLPTPILPINSSYDEYQRLLEYHQSEMDYMIDE